ncbi:MAG: hypothetical protein PHP42_13195 [Bacteroidota bacterium]|nr:hypothetical protein [Bacteroidota bacterium]
MKNTFVKTIFTFVAVVMMTSVNGIAQSNDTALDSSIYKRKINNTAILNNFQMSLKSDIKGIIEGTIYNIVVYKRYFPQMNYSKIIDNLEIVIQENEDPSISYKAQLAIMYLRHANRIDISPVGHAIDHEYLFKEISEKLEKELLVVND